MIPDVSILIMLSAMLMIVASGIIILVLLYRRKRQRYMQEREQLKTQFENNILKARLEIQEQTFKNISQEIHDNIGQMLTLTKLHLNTINFPDTNSADEKLTEAKNSLTKAIQSLRDISKTMNSDVVSKMGIAHAIENELQNISKLSSLQVDFNWTDEIVNINPQVELILFRMVQEILHNVIKHSQAGKVEVSGTYVDGIFQLVISDNGVGFTPTEIDFSGSGLINLESRCKLINADLQINSFIGKGTIITISLPVLPTENTIHLIPKD